MTSRNATLVSTYLLNLLAEERNVTDILTKDSSLSTGLFARLLFTNWRIWINKKR